MQHAQARFRLGAALQPLQRVRHLDLGADVQRRVGRHPLVEQDRVLAALHPLEDVGQRDQRHLVVRVEMDRQPQVDDRRHLVALAVAGRAQRVEHLGRARGDGGRGARGPLAGLERRDPRLGDGVARHLLQEGLVDGDRLLEAPAHHLHQGQVVQEDSHQRHQYHDQDVGERHFAKAAHAGPLKSTNGYHYH